MYQNNDAEHRISRRSGSENQRGQSFCGKLSTGEQIELDGAVLPPALAEKEPQRRRLMLFLVSQIFDLENCVDLPVKNKTAVDVKVTAKMMREKGLVEKEREQKQ